MRLCAVVAHPDDESWACGGLLAAAADAGVEVHVVVATAGEAGASRQETLTPAQLAARRLDELAAAGAVLGIAGWSCLGLRDGLLTRADLERPLARALDSLDPHLLLTLDEDGGYGHLDHLAVTEAVLATRRPTTRACFPAGLLHPVWRALRRRGFDGVVRGWAPERFGVAAPERVVPCDGRKRAAIAAHASQLRDGDPLTLLGPTLAPLLEQEWYRGAAEHPLWERL